MLNNGTGHFTDFLGIANSYSYGLSKHTLKMSDGSSGVRYEIMRAFVELRNSPHFLMTYLRHVYNGFHVCLCY